MGQWDQVQSLPAVRKLYSLPFFPFELRHLFAAWIEAQPWMEINVAEPTSAATATRLVKEFHGVIQKKIVEYMTIPSEEATLTRLRLEDISAAFQQAFAPNPTALVQFLQGSLQRELVELKTAQEQASSGDHGGGASVPTDPKVTETPGDQSKVDLAFHFLKWVDRNTDQDIQKTHAQQETFVIQYQENSRLAVEAQQFEARIASASDAEKVHLKVRASEIIAHRKTLETKIHQEAEAIRAARQAIFAKIADTHGKLRDLQQLILEGVMQWRVSQMRGEHSEEAQHDRLAKHQVLVESLAVLLWKTRQQVKQMIMAQTGLPLQGERSFQELLPHFNSLVIVLVQKTFVVDKQPLQVLKTQTKFTTSLRSILGQSLNLHMDPPEVICSIVNETQGRLIEAESSKLDLAILPQHPTSGELVNNRKTMHYYADRDAGVLSTPFKNMSLRKHKRGGLKADQVVTEEKFAIVYLTGVRLDADLAFQVRVLSLPLVVVVHGNQQANAEATVLWNNAFSDLRSPFTVPSVVPWRLMGAALHRWFRVTIQEELTDEQVAYLGTKLLPEGMADPNFQLTWAQFNKEPMRDRAFTFWDWFYGAADLIRKHLSGPWNAGLIQGFVSKDKVQRMLQTCAPGTFILRFSDSAVGGITIAWIGEDEAGNKLVWNLQPWYAKDFGVRQLADRIHDLPQLQFLYPDISKATAFQRFITEPKRTTISADYVPSGIAAVIPKSKVAENVFPIVAGTPGPFGIAGGDQVFQLASGGGAVVRGFGNMVGHAPTSGASFGLGAPLSSDFPMLLTDALPAGGGARPVPPSSTTVAAVLSAGELGSLNL